ncbi:hypothetical protein E4T44_12685 [Aureobasidium sp. EXF-8845]|nr:hypothetical protein E4T44_12685 [Aureobasidium sp. EXF-8845]KAI4793407.1 hypothetical protein E4T45_12569 [Aureobasidium sp. EXF-8846]
MLAIKKSENSTPTCAVNVLPCRIQHNGPVNATTRHWTPQVSADGKSNTAYFRGRKLNGTVVNLPDGYTDTILPTTNTTTTTSSDLLDEAEEEQDSTPETKVLRELATFDKITVYGHEVQPDVQEDVYVKGINEWFGLAGVRVTQKSSKRYRRRGKKMLSNR